MNVPFHIYRLEQDVNAKDALLLTEKRAHETTQKTLTEAQERNEELLNKIHEDDKTILQLKFTVQRSIAVFGLLIQISNSYSNISINSRTLHCQLCTCNVADSWGLQLLEQTYLIPQLLAAHYFFLHTDRLEENTAANENMLLREKEQNDATTKAHIESQERYEVLLKKFVDVDSKIDLLQDTIERCFHPSILARSISVCASLCFYYLCLVMRF